MSDPNESEMDNQRPEDNNNIIIELNKKKTTSQSSFTRLLNSVNRLLGDESMTPKVLQKNIEDLEERYKTFENKCEAILDLIDESNPLHNEIDSVLADKYELLNDLRNEVCKRTELSVTLNESTASASIASNISESNGHTEELIRSFKASLTLPKP